MAVGRVSFFLLFALLMAAAVVMMVASPYIGGSLADVRVSSHSHAELRHGSDAVAVRKCIEDNGPTMLMLNTTTNRWAEICQLPDGRWGVRIVEQVKGVFEELTGFADDTWETIADVERYLWNQGYGMP